MKPAPAAAAPSRLLVPTLAFGTAASVATLYFNQPLLPVLARDFQASEHQVGLLVTVTQLGYAAGILALVPLGDSLNKKALILAKLGVLLLALVGAAAARSLAMLFAAHLAIGLFSTAAQDFVPLAADLAAPQKRGHVIGIVMSGLLLGILASRTFSGVVADHAGWRAVFVVAAVIIAAIAAFVVAVVPSRAPAAPSDYGALMRSMFALLRRHRVLRLSIATQGLMGAVFSAFWTVIAFHLGAPPFAWSTSAIGTFGLVGAAGALAAPLAGRLADRRGPSLNIAVAIAITFAAFVVMMLAPSSLAALIAGATIFDLGVQMSMVSHQSIIYALDPSARSRINALFVGGLFLCFAAGSFAGNALHAAFGWRGLTGFCLACCAGASALHRVRAAAVD